MFRRIKFINPPKVFSKENNKYCIHGIMGASDNNVIEAWIYHLRGPWGRRSGKIPNNARFYFTEKGWDLVGKYVIKECIKAKQEYRVIKVKEDSVNVIWKDDYTGYEIAAQPKKDLTKIKK